MRCSSSAKAAEGAKVARTEAEAGAEEASGVLSPEEGIDAERDLVPLPLLRAVVVVVVDPAVAALAAAAAAAPIAAEDAVAKHVVEATGVEASLNSNAG